MNTELSKKVKNDFEKETPGKRENYGKHMKVSGHKTCNNRKKKKRNYMVSESNFNTTISFQNI